MMGLRENLLNFLALRNTVFSFLSGRALLSYMPFSYKKNRIYVYYFLAKTTDLPIRS